MNPPEWPDFDEKALGPQERAKLIYEAKVASIREGIKADVDHQYERLGASEDDAIDSAKAIRDARIAREKAQSDAFDSWATANRAADIANLQKFHDSMSSVATGSIDRARAGADLVQKASAAIATLYTGILALVFSVTDNPLPSRGVLAPLFLGLAVVLSTAYTAYLGPTEGLTPGPKPVLGLEPKSFQRLNTIIRVASGIATRRSGYLRASVVSLGVGLAFIVLPFISFGSSLQPTSASQATPEWPPPPTTNAPTELNAILYEAQVQEIAAARAEAASSTRENDTLVLIVGLVAGAAAVIFVPMILPSDSQLRGRTALDRRRLRSE